MKSRIAGKLVTQGLLVLLCAYGFLGGAVSFAGWVLDMPRLAAWAGNGITMQPNTALTAIAASIALFLLLRGAATGAALLAALVAASGGVTLLEHVAGVDLGIDRLFLFGREWGTVATVAPGRMGVPASTSWILLGTAIILAARGGRARGAAIVPGVAAAAIAFLSINGYALGASTLYSVPRLTAIAFPTATVVLALSVGLIGALRDQMPVRILSERSAAGTLARRALPLIITIPAIVGWLRNTASEAGFFDSAFGTALRTVVEVSLLLILLWWAVFMVRAHEQALRTNEEFSRRVVEESHDCIEVIDLEGKLLSMSAAGQRLFGIDDIREHLGRPWVELWGGENEESAGEALKEALSGRGGRFAAFLPTRSGEPKWWEVTITPMIAAEGKPEKLLVVSRDVTQRMRAEETRASLAAIVETSDDAIVSKTVEGVIKSWNRGAERLFGYTAEEAVGRSIELIIPPEGRDEERRILGRLRRGERIAHYETVRVAKNGDRLDISLSVSPIRDATGRVIGASKVARDVTEKKRIESELRTHREHLQQLVHNRTAELEASHRHLRAAERLASLGTLAAGLGHDMGNLLTPLRVRLESLSENQLSVSEQEDIAAIRTSVEYLQRLVKGLRLLSLDPENPQTGETTQLRTWWLEAQSVMKSVLPRGVVLEAHMPDEECVVPIAPPTLTQAVFNLIQNAGDAMRERGKGRVTLEAVRRGAWLELRVSDDGPGMTPEVQARCLEPFFTTKARAISTGLGLSLVQGVIRNAGGRVELESEVGRGTTFSLYIPLVASGESVASVAPSRRGVIHMQDARLRSFVMNELQSLQYEVDGSWSDSEVDLVVVDDIAKVTATARRAQIILLGEGTSEAANVHVLGKRPSIAAVRVAIRECARQRAVINGSASAGGGAAEARGADDDCAVRG